MENQKVLHRRYKDKMFQEVYQLNRESSEDAQHREGFSKYYPRKCNDYRNWKAGMKINERWVSGFVDRWSPNMRSEFSDLVGDLAVVRKNVHSQSTAETNGDIGVFYRMFVRKCIYNLKNEDARLPYVEKYAAVFPFKVTKDVRDVNIPVRELFDEQFYNTVGEFMGQHFSDVSVAELVDLLLKNVYQFRQTNFTTMQCRQLEVMYESNFTAPSFKTGVQKSQYVCEYLREFPRLNYNGVHGFDQLCRMYKEIFRMYHEEEPEEVSEVWRYLPEINCYELLRLLEPDFFEDRRVEYEKLLKKYLFFFNNAINSEEKPVFFIDKLLFECLKSFEQFQTSRTNPAELQFVLWMISLVRRRGQPLDSGRSNPDRTPKEIDMANLQDYIESYPEIKSASLDLLIETKIINSRIFITTPTCLINFCFSKRPRTEVSDFAPLVIEGALCPRDIKTLVIYNGYLGEETSVEMPQVKAEILNFVGRHNPCNMSINLPPEEHMTRHIEHYFEARTIDWQKKMRESEK